MVDSENVARPRAEDSTLRFLVRWIESPDDGEDGRPTLPEPEVYLTAEGAATRVARLLKELDGHTEGYDDLPALLRDARALVRVVERSRVDVFVGPLYLSASRTDPALVC